MSRLVVGSTVRVLASGRIGELVLDDNSELPLKVAFSDGALPHSDWFLPRDVSPLAAPTIEPATDATAGCTQLPENGCPICFATELNRPVVTTCGHSFCAACIEQTITSRSEDMTRGQCPMCRAEVSLFELRTEAGELAHSRGSDLSALYGCVFVIRRQRGYGSFHFESGSDPYISYEPSLVRSSQLKLDDGSAPPERKYFDEPLWHEATRTFHATVNWSPKTWHGSSKWRYVMQFPSDRGYICDGSVSFLRREEDCVMDGEWQVEWENGYTARLTVEGGSWELEGVVYTLDLHDPLAPSFSWPGLGTTQRSSVDVRCMRHVGGRLLWTTDHKEYPRIWWTRLGAALPTVAAPLTRPFGAGGWQYVRSHDSPAPGHVSSSLWGNAYMQDLKVGKASYHFLDESAGGEARAYIAYEHPDCATWGTLDNDRPIPSRVPFIDVEWRSDGRLFKGVIDWIGLYGTTFQGVEQWHYEMIFDGRFSFVSSGTCREVLSGGKNSPGLIHFGEDLAYVHTATRTQLMDRKVAGETWEDVRASYASGGASGRIIALLRRAWVA